MKQFAILLLLVYICSVEATFLFCKSDEHKCLGEERCLHKIRMCDGYKDCTSGSDEFNCNDCSFKCSDRSGCINAVDVCDDYVDCQDGSDERNCSSTAPCVGFLCPNKKCIDVKALCDGHLDCSDGSDEFYCEVIDKFEMIKDCSHGYLCSDGTCIDDEHVCDGKKDCLGKGEDEDVEMCSHYKCDKQCDHYCLHSHKGSSCGCNPGYELAKDGKSCKMVDACFAKKCSHGCGKYIGNEVICDCGSYGFLFNQIHCRSQDLVSVIYSKGKNIVMAPFNNLTQTKLIFEKKAFPITHSYFRDLAVDMKNGKVYGTFYRDHAVLLDISEGTVKQILPGLNISEIAVDPITDNVYFISYTEDSAQIRVCEPDFIYCRTLFDNLKNPENLVLHHIQAYLMYSDATTKSIYKAPMDGDSGETSKPKVVVSGFDHIHSIAMDAPGDRIYWADGHQISYTSLANGKTFNFTRFPGKSHPHKLAVFEENLFWSSVEGVNAVLYKTDKFVADHHTLIDKALSPYMDIEFGRKQMEITTRGNPCHSKACDHFCTLREANSLQDKAACQCSDGYTLATDGRTCIAIPPYFIMAGESIRYLPIDVKPGSPYAISTQSTLDIQALTVDQVNQRLYGVNHHKELFTAPLDDFGKMQVLLKSDSLQYIYNMQFYHPNNLIYYMSLASDIVFAYDVQLNETQVIFRAESYLRSVTIDEVKRYLYVQVGRNLFRTWMDGSHKEHIVVANERGVDLSNEKTSHLISNPHYNRMQFVSPKEVYTFPNRDSLAMTATGRPIVYDGKDVGRGFIMKVEANIDGSILMVTSEGTFILKPVGDGIVAEFVTGDSDIAEAVASYSLDYKHTNAAMIDNTTNACYHPDRKLCGHGCVVSPDDQALCLCPVGKEFDAGMGECVNKSVCTSPSMFNCPNTLLCYPKAFVCDFEKDCPNGEDEQDCSADCHEGMFSCTNGACVSHEDICDGVPDCPFGDDEKNCPEDHHMYHCRDSNETIPYDYVCDKQQDCPNGDDETNDHCTCTDVCDTLCLTATDYCDGIHDCADDRDEKNCPETDTKCLGESFQCASGDCIPLVFKCDGFVDCDVDASDEKDCRRDMVELHHRQDESCGEGELLCDPVLGTAKHCIDLIQICDGVQDCGGNTDEMFCNTFKTNETYCGHLDGFWCATERKCLFKFEVCDGEINCRGGSDEDISICMNDPHHPYNIAFDDELSDVCDAQHYRCDNHKCIDVLKVCDGNDDCGDYSDEGAACHKNECLEANCEHGCHTTPYGYQCLCDKGYQLSFDKHNCEDIDECLHEGLYCSQHCHNLMGGYRCSCTEGYSLSHDRKTCKVDTKHKHPYLMFLNNDKNVMAVSTEGQHKTIYYVVEGNHNINDFTLDVGNGHIYYTEATHGNIMSLDIEDVNATQRTMLSNVVSPSFIDYDWVQNMVYFVDGLSTIQACTNTFDKCTTVVHVNSDTYIGSLVLLASEGTMFWSRWAPKNHSMSGMIEKANMDGSNRKIIVSEALIEPSSLSIDYIHRDLYFADLATGVVYRVDFNGRHRRRMFKSHSGRLHSFTLLPEHMFYSDLNDLYKVDWPRSDHQQILTHGKGLTPTLKVYHPLRQPQAVNSCSQTKCEQMCLLTHDSFKCACTHGYHLNDDNKTCSEGEPVDVATLEFIELCSPQCQNGGKCVAHREHHICVCPDDYAGEACQIFEPRYWQKQSSSIGYIVVLVVFISVALAFLFWYTVINKDVDYVSKRRAQAQNLMNKLKQKANKHKGCDDTDPLVDYMPDNDEIEANRSNESNDSDTHVSMDVAAFEDFNVVNLGDDMLSFTTAGGVSFNTSRANTYVVDAEIEARPQTPEFEVSQDVCFEVPQSPTVAPQPSTSRVINPFDEDD